MRTEPLSRKSTPAVHQSVAAIETLTDDILNESRELANERDYYRSLWQDTMAERDRLREALQKLATLDGLDPATVRHIAKEALDA